MSFPQPQGATSQQATSSSRAGLSAPFLPHGITATYVQPILPSLGTPSRMESGSSLRISDKSHGWGSVIVVNDEGRCAEVRNQLNSESGSGMLLRRLDLRVKRRPC